MTIEEKHEYSIDFYKNIFQGRSFNSNSMIEEYYQFFKETLYPFTWTSNQSGIIQLREFLDMNSHFLLTPIEGLVNLTEMEDKIELGELSKKYKVELLIPSYETLQLYLEWIYNRKLSFKVINGPYLPYLFVETDKTIKTHSKLFNRYLIIDFENDEKSVFASVYGPNSSFKCLLNKNNPFIQYISNNIDFLDESIKFLIKELFSMITDLNYPQALDSELKREYSEIISRINSTYNTNFDTSF